MLIPRRSNCINTASDIVTLCKWLLSAPAKRGLLLKDEHNGAQWCSKHVEGYSKCITNIRMKELCIKLVADYCYRKFV
jgi:hypothetical protein